MFAKVLKLLPKMGTKKQDTTVEKQGSENMQSTTPSTMPRKKGMSSADMVFFGGLVLLIGGGLWFALGGIEGTEEQETQTPTTQIQGKSNQSQKSSKPQMPTVPNTLEKTLTVPTAGTVEETTKANEPFVYENSADFSDDTLIPPPKEYEQNISKIAKKMPAQAPQIPETKSTMPRKTEKIVSKSAQKHEKALLETPTQETVSTQPVAAKSVAIQKSSAAIPLEPHNIAKTESTPAGKQISMESSDNYVCTIVEAYRNMLGKEIMYYVKSTKGYTPAYAQKNWDESGVLVKTKLVAIRVDIAERMVEVSPGKWIPALEFMTCTIVQEGI